MFHEGVGARSGTKSNAVLSSAKFVRNPDTVDGVQSGSRSSGSGSSAVMVCSPTWISMVR